MNSSDTELVQNRLLNGGGPSSKTWPIWQPHLRQEVSCISRPLSMPSYLSRNGIRRINFDRYTTKNRERADTLIIGRVFMRFAKKSANRGGDGEQNENKLRKWIRFKYLPPRYESIVFRSIIFGSDSLREAGPAAVFELVLASEQRHLASNADVRSFLPVVQESTCIGGYFQVLEGALPRYIDGVSPNQGHLHFRFRMRSSIAEVVI